MRTFTRLYKINAPISKVWQALTDPEVINEWGGGPSAKMSTEEGDEFSLWGGDIYGKNIQVEPGKLLVQDWYGGKWERPSQVTFELFEVGEKTEVKLTHADFPEQVSQQAIDDFASGWDEYYMGPLQELVEED
jgi:uncharacterized protein YndB with AHSA1/START domain